MNTYLDTLPQMTTLPGAFADASDRARTDGKLCPAVRRQTTRTQRHRFINARKQTAADRILERLPQPGEALHLVLDGSFDLCHLIPRVVALAAETVKALDLMTLGFNDATVDVLTQLADAGQVEAPGQLACPGAGDSEKTAGQSLDADPSPPTCGRWRTVRPS